ncbi:DUF4865 family protein [Kribbella antibiotica]|nr:DUF4865 family protein [Kribbella antibiotica]
MIVMQYQLPLPSDYDVSTLRDRIPAIGARFDNLPGLGFKAFLLREQGVNGSPLNQYAPFYVWTDPAAAGAFLWDGASGGFTGVVGKYGRPAAQIWITGGYHRGAGFGAPVTHAVRVVTPVPADIDPAETATATRETVDKRLDEADLHSMTWAIDPRTWELLTFTMHTKRPDVSEGELYEVPYVSAPNETALQPA